MFFVEPIGHRHRIVSIKIGASHHLVCGKKTARQRREGQSFIDEFRANSDCLRSRHHVQRKEISRAAVDIKCNDGSAVANLFDTPRRIFIGFK